MVTGQALIFVLCLVTAKQSTTQRRLPALEQRYLKIVLLRLELQEVQQL